MLASLFPAASNKQKSIFFGWQMEYLAYMWARRFRLLEFYRSLGRGFKGVDDFGGDVILWICFFAEVLWILPWSMTIK